MKTTIQHSTHLVAALRKGAAIIEAEVPVSEDQSRYVYALRDAARQITQQNKEGK